MGIILPLIISFFSGIGCLMIIIPILQKEKIDQTERKEVTLHKKKQGTPTMGGIAIIVSFIFGSFPFMKSEPLVLPVLILTVGFGLIGFLDDFLKVIKHNSDGLIAWQKLILQLIFTTIFLFMTVKKYGISLSLRIPFMHGKMVNIGWMAIVLFYFAVLGTVNGTNFTDGIDGLLSSVTLPISIFFAVVSLMLHRGTVASGLAMTGALLSFLMFNAHPAKIFMGDTGSLAIGGFVSGMAYILNMPLYILIIGFIYLIEVLSVIVQVSYFKATHGKRVFKMTPIHHHFELSGWSETMIMVRFTIITILLCFVGISAL